MARIEIDPNYSSPTFSRATAATDIFKKEDVQSLAAALSTHVHDGAGKGLTVVPGAGSIPGTALADGGVTSAKIADGTIATADIAANAVTQFVAAVGSTVSPSTTSNVAVDLPDLSVTLTTTGGKLIVFVNVVLLWAGTVGNSAVIQLNIDGGDVAGSIRRWVAPAVGYMETLTLVYDLSGYAAISHTVKARWSVTGSGSTLTANGGERSIIVMEFKK